jgi:hypothetical protein
LGGANGLSARIEIDNFGGAGYLSVVSYGGNNGSPAALVAATEIGGVNSWGYNGTAIVGPQASFRMYANQNWSVGANGTYADIATTPNGSTTLTQVAKFENDGGVTVPGTVTGGSKGAGTVNLTNGYYVGGVQLATFGAAGTLLQGQGIGATPIFSSTVGLGISGSVQGSLTFVNLTSGSITIQPATGALGSGVATLPAGTYTLAGLGLSQTFSGNNTFSGTVTLPSVNSSSVVQVLNGGSAQGVEAGSLCVDSTYSNCSTLPTNGLQVLGGTILKNAVSLTGLGTSGTCANSLLVTSAGVVFGGSCPGASSSVQQGVTTVTSASGSNQILTTGTVSGGTGILTNVTLPSLFSAGSGISFTGTNPLTIALSLGNATLQASPSNPTGTTSTTPVMAGLGGTCHITPVYSGRIKVEFIATVGNSTSGATVTNTVRFGTGTAPANGVAATGTQVGTGVAYTAPASNYNEPIFNGGIITGLSTGTAYWLDITEAVSTGTGSYINVSCNAMEF